MWRVVCAPVIVLDTSGHHGNMAGGNDIIEEIRFLHHFRSNVIMR